MGKAISFRKHSQTFEDLFWAMMQAIKDSPFISHEYSATGFAFHFAIVRTVFIPAK